MSITGEKIAQAVGVLDELDIDLWLLFGRESAVMADPAFELVVGHGVVWQSAFFITRSGETIALVGSYDAADFERTGEYGEVRTYVEDCGGEIRKLLESLNPGKIALDYSVNDVMSDGLTHGMYLLLSEYLEGTFPAERFISSEEIVSRVRGRKTEGELAAIRRAVRCATDCWDAIGGRIEPGMTEIEIADLVTSAIRGAGAVNSFEPIVNAGAKSSPGHGRPTSAVLAGGDLLHVDFGARLDGYCSDLQRLIYFPRANETAAPADLSRAFDTVKSIVDVTSAMYKPGERGFRIDAVARDMLKRAGYPEYGHALGHQIGRAVHDGAAVIGPQWKRYGNTTSMPLEKGNTFTVELGIELPGIGYVGMEEDLVVTESGGEFLGPRQTGLPVARTR